jgi:hypothetical protein
MIAGRQTDKDGTWQKTSASVDAVPAIKRRGCRRLNQITVRFRPVVGFHVPIRYEFATPSYETLLPDLNKAREVLAVV